MHSLHLISTSLFVFMHHFRVSVSVVSDRISFWISYGLKMILSIFNSSFFISTKKPVTHKTIDAAVFCKLLNRLAA